MTPVLLGPAGEVFAAEAVPDSPRSDAVGVVVRLHDVATQNPIGVGLARALSAAGHHVVVIDDAGRGWSSQSKWDLGHTLSACVGHLESRGATRIGLVVASEYLTGALRYALEDDRVIGVASASLPVPERSVAPEQVSLTAVRQRGVGRTLRLLQDRERRRRILKAVREKIRSVNSGGASGTPTRDREAGIEHDLRTATEAGVNILVVGGWKDRTSRMMRNLAASSSADRLLVALDFGGRMATFETIAAQAAFTESVTHWLGRLTTDL